MADISSAVAIFRTAGERKEGYRHVSVTPWIRRPRYSEDHKIGTKASQVNVKAQRKLARDRSATGICCPKGSLLP
jgi:hypothetical protein